MNVRMKHTIIVALLAAPVVLIGPSESLAEDTGPVPDYSYPYFIQPEPNASFPEAPATFDVEIGIYTGLEGLPIDGVDLLLDGDLLGTQACAMGCVFPAVEVSQGIHVLSVRAPANNSMRYTTVYVDEEIPADTGAADSTDGGSGGGEGSSDTGGGGDGGGGGGCQASELPSAPWGLLALPALLLLPGLRRRRRG